MVDGVKKLIVGRFPDQCGHLEPVDLVYADPPFGTGGDFSWYDDSAHGWRESMTRCLASIDTLVKPSGSAWLHVDDTDLGWLLSHVGELAPGLTHIATIAWQRTYGIKNQSGIIASTYDSILVLAGRDFFPRPLPADPGAQNLFIGWDGDQPWSSADLSAPRADKHPGLVYGIASPLTGKVHYPRPGRHWSYSIEVMADKLSAWGTFTPRMLDDRGVRAAICAPTDPGAVPALMFDGRAADAAKVQEGVLPPIMFGRAGQGGPRRKVYASTTRTPTDFWGHQVAGHVQQARSELHADLPGSSFPTPKPAELLNRIMMIATDPGDLVLDPFAGSGATAAAAHRMGRNFVTVEANADLARALTIPRLRAVCSGHRPRTSSALARPLPYKMRKGQASDAAVALRSLRTDGRLEVPEDILRSLISQLGEADRCVTTSHPVPNETLEVVYHQEQA